MANYKKMINNKKATKFIIKDVPAYFLDDTTDEVFVEISNVLKSIPFNKISIPLNAYREDVLNEPGNIKCITVGFIKSFNPKKLTFNIIVFNAFKEVVENFENYGIEVNFGLWDNHLSRINRLALINVPAEEYTDDGKCEEESSDLPATVGIDTVEEESEIEQTETEE